MQKIKIIYLDIDGVLISHRYWKEVPEEVRDSKRDKFGESFDQYSSNLLNNLIEETEAKIVITSVWRYNGLKTIQDLWKERGMSGEVIDITPDYYRKVRMFKVPRGCEIQAHYKKSTGLSIGYGMEICLEGQWLNQHLRIMLF